MSRYLAFVRVGVSLLVQLGPSNIVHTTRIPPATVASRLSCECRTHFRERLLRSRRSFCAELPNAPVRTSDVRSLDSRPCHRLSLYPHFLFLLPWRYHDLTISLGKVSRNGSPTERFVTCATRHRTIHGSIPNERFTLRASRRRGVPYLHIYPTPHAQRTNHSS